MKEIQKDKIYRSVASQLSQIGEINAYHNKIYVERSVRIINGLKKRAEDRIAGGTDEAEVNKWLEKRIERFKVDEGGCTFEEISGYWREKVRTLKAEAIDYLMKKSLILQKLSTEEKDPEKSLAISKDCTKYMEAANYINENINYIE